MQRCLPAGALALALVLGARADTLPPGFRLQVVPDEPGALIATLSDRTYVAFDGHQVTLHGPSGGVLQTLATLSDTDFPSFVRIDPGETFAVVGESLNGGVYRVPLTGGGATPITTLQFNYDASFLDGDTLYVSASHDAAFDNEVYRVELDPPAVTQVASLPGFSGPLQVRANGDLYYGTAEFPVPAGGARVLRFGAAALASATVLHESDAALVGAGFAGASSFAYDAARDELYLAASDFVSGVNRLYRVEGGAAASPLLLDGTPGGFVGNLEFLVGDDARALLRAFQPDGGGRLRYTSLVARTELAALRPAGFLSGPGLSGPGAFDVNVADAAPGGMAFTLYGPAELVLAPDELAVFLPNQALNVFLGLDPFTMLFDAVPFAIDGAGAGAKGYTNPGGLEGEVAIQLLLLRDDGSIAGTSDVRFL